MGTKLRISERNTKFIWVFPSERTPALAPEHLLERKNFDEGRNHLGHTESYGSVVWCGSACHQQAFEEYFWRKWIRSQSGCFQNGNNHSTWCNRRKNSKEWDIFLFNLKALGHSWKIMFPQSSKFCYQFWDTARKRHFLTLVTKKLANLVTKSVTKLSNHVHFRIYAFRLRTRRLNIFLPAWCLNRQVERSWISMSYG